jgi:hypothetical protein
MKYFPEHSHYLIIFCVTIILLGITLQLRTVQS